MDSERQNIMKFRQDDYGQSSLESIENVMLRTISEVRYSKELHTLPVMFLGSKDQRSSWIHGLAHQPDSYTSLTREHLYVPGKNVMFEGARVLSVSTPQAILHTQRHAGYLYIQGQQGGTFEPHQPPGPLSTHRMV